MFKKGEPQSGTYQGSLELVPAQLTEVLGQPDDAVRGGVYMIHYALADEAGHAVRLYTQGYHPYSCARQMCHYRVATSYPEDMTAFIAWVKEAGLAYKVL